jgi:hypothetical protein
MHHLGQTAGRRQALIWLATLLKNVCRLRRCVVEGCPDACLNEVIARPELPAARCCARWLCCTIRQRRPRDRGIDFLVESIEALLLLVAQGAVERVKCRPATCTACSIASTQLRIPAARPVGVLGSSLGQFAWRMFTALAVAACKSLSKAR